MYDRPNLPRDGLGDMSTPSARKTRVNSIKMGKTNYKHMINKNL